ncbi:MAG: hypothetical protein HY720_28720 [Planctomycetes bacterium]|nr:hypothetical protein [Planctomycetota bacterium]
MARTTLTALSLLLIALAPPLAFCQDEKAPRIQTISSGESVTISDHLVRGQYTLVYFAIGG